MLMDLVDRAVKVTGPIGPPENISNILLNRAKGRKFLLTEQEVKYNIRDKTPVRVLSRKMIRIFILTVLHVEHKMVNLYLRQ